MSRPVYSHPRSKSCPHYQLLYPIHSILLSIADSSHSRCISVQSLLLFNRIIRSIRIIIVIIIFFIIIFLPASF